MAFGNATKGYVKKHSGGGGGGGTTNYSELSNKPQINGVTLDGNKTSEDLGISGGGGASMVVYNEKIVTDQTTNNYNLGAKLVELGMSGDDVAFIHCQPQYIGNAEPKGCRIYYGNYNEQSYNTVAVNGNDSVGIDCILTTSISNWSSTVLKIKYDASDNRSKSDLSIRIIKATNNN